MEQHPRSVEPHRLILLKNEVGAHGEHDGECVRVRFDVCLRVEPIEDTEGHIKCLFAVFLVLRESTRLKKIRECVVSLELR